MSSSTSMSLNFLDMNPIHFIDDVINSVEDYLADGLDNLEKTLVNDCQIDSNDLERRKQVSDAVDVLFKQLQTNSFKNLDIFELYALKNIFKPPTNLNSMNQQDVKTITTTIEEENLVDEEINKLYAKYTQTIAYNRQLKSEINNLQQKVDTIKSQEFIAKLKTADIPNKVRRILKLSKDYNSQINQLKASSLLK